MAVARVKSAESVRTATTDPWTFAFTPTGTPRGIVLAVVHGVSATAYPTSVTYGGVALAKIVEAADTATEPGNASLWFVGANIPTGQQTVSVDLSSATATDIHFVIWELSAAADLEVIDFDSLNQNAANPTVTLQAGGRTKLSIAAMYGGGAAPGGTLATGNTLDHTHDLGAFYSQTCYETTVDNADHTIGWSTLGTDDLAFAAVAVSEVQAAPPPITGTLATTNAADTLVASGTVSGPVFTGTVATTNADDTLAASGTVTMPTVSGTLATTNAADTLTAAGTFAPPPVTGTLDITTTADTAVGSGSHTPPAISGTVAITESADTVVMSGTAAAPTITGTLAVTGAADTLTSVGIVADGDSISGTIHLTEVSDIVVGQGKTRRRLTREECCAHHEKPGHVCVTRNPEPLFD